MIHCLSLFYLYLWSSHRSYVRGQRTNCYLRFLFDHLIWLEQSRFTDLIFGTISNKHLKHSQKSLQNSIVKKICEINFESIALIEWRRMFLFSLLKIKTISYFGNRLIDRIDEDKQNPFSYFDSQVKVRSEQNWKVDRLEKRCKKIPLIHRFLLFEFHLKIKNFLYSQIVGSSSVEDLLIFWTIDVRNSNRFDLVRWFFFFFDIRKTSMKNWLKVNLE